VCRATARTCRLRIWLEVVHEARLRLDPAEPGLDRRVIPELDARVPGDVRVGVEADVRDGVARAEEEVACRELALEDGDCVAAHALPALDERVMAGGATREDPEAAGADVRLEQVLLEEEPLSGLRSPELVVGQERCAFRQIEEDGT